MTKLKNIYVEKDSRDKHVVCIDWDNDRHQRVVIDGVSPEAVARGLKSASDLITIDVSNGEI